MVIRPYHISGIMIIGRERVTGHAYSFDEHGGEFTWSEEVILDKPLKNLSKSILKGMLVVTFMTVITESGTETRFAFTGGWRDSKINPWPEVYEHPQVKDLISRLNEGVIKRAGLTFVSDLAKPNI